MSTLKTTNLQHPDALVANLVLGSDGVVSGPGFESGIAAGLTAASVLKQVVVATDSTQRITTSTTMTDASISVSITPTDASSTIYVIWSGTARTFRNSTGQNAIRLQITDSADTPLTGGGDGFALGGNKKQTGTGAANVEQSLTVVSKVAATDTSVRTYKLRFSVETNADSGNAELQNQNSTGLLIAMEVQ